MPAVSTYLDWPFFDPPHRELQMFGGRGVVHGVTVERLYRDIRALRIYEGASEVQQLIIARELLAETERS